MSYFFWANDSVAAIEINPNKKTFFILLIFICLI